MKKNKKYLKKIQELKKDPEFKKQIRERQKLVEEQLNKLEKMRGEVDWREYYWEVDGGIV